MENNKFELKLKKTGISDIEKGYKDNYKKWRKHKKYSKGTFFAIYKDLYGLLGKISNGALKLYIYYGFASKNETGDSWHAVSTVAKELDVVPRTIDKWNKELEELGLIKRIATGKKSKTVFLLPISDYILNFNNLIKINEWLLSDTFETLYGAPKYAFKFIQAISSQEVKYKCYHVLVSEKKYGKINKRCVIFKAITEIDGMIPDIDFEELSDSICKLETNDNIESINIDLHIEHWFVDSKIIKLDNDKKLIDFIHDFMDSEVDKEAYEVHSWKPASEE